VFAAGIILWELLVGRRLYKPRSETSLLVQAQRAEIPPVPDKGLANHDKLEAIVRRALAKDREERYPSAGAMLRDLEDYLGESGLLASRLKLGEWIGSTFGTDPVEKRRASERRLPKSDPPLRSSERVAKAVELPVSDGAMRAFKKELESGPDPGRLTFEPESLAGAVMDVAPSSGHPVDAGATGRDSTADTDPPARAKHPASALLAIAGIAVIVAALVALIRLFVQ
ncbi:MAG TPA: hypothetical protein VLT33_24185, partial [Labilithrix sp.]|nr:hypothetical protein [Labilithrix sp.]